MPRQITQILTMVSFTKCNSSTCPEWTASFFPIAFVYDIIRHPSSLKSLTTHPHSWEANDWSYYSPRGLFGVGKLPRNKYFSNKQQEVLIKDRHPFQKLCFIMHVVFIPKGSQVHFHFAETRFEWEVLQNKWVVSSFYPFEKECQWKTMNSAIVGRRKSRRVWKVIYCS